MNESTRNLIDTMVGVKAETNPMYNKELTVAERLLILIFKDFEQHGVAQMHWTQVMEKIGYNRITTYRMLKNLKESGWLKSSGAGYYTLNK